MALIDEILTVLSSSSLSTMNAFPSASTSQPFVPDIRNYVIAFSIIFSTCVSAGLTPVGAPFDINNYLENSLIPEIKFPTFSFNDTAHEQSIIIRVIKSQDKGIVLQGLGTSPSSPTMPIYKKSAIQKTIHRFQNAFLSKLLYNEYGTLHLVGLAPVIIVNICAYLTAKDLGRLELTTRKFFHLQDLNIVWRDLFNRLQGSFESVSSSSQSTYKSMYKSAMNDRRERELAAQRREQERQTFLQRTSRYPGIQPLHPTNPFHPPSLLEPIPRIYPTHPRIRLPGDDDEFLPPPFENETIFPPFTGPYQGGRAPLSQYIDPLTGLPSIPPSRDPLQPLQHPSRNLDPYNDPFSSGRRGGGGGLGGGFGGGYGGGFGGGF